MLDIVLRILHYHINPYNISGVHVMTTIFYFRDKQAQSLRLINDTQLVPNYSLPSLEDYISLPVAI